MASAGGEQQQPQPSPRLLTIPKEGERILAPTRRPDGSLRKPIRIRAGYVPQEEVAIYQPKPALLKKEARSEVPPGYDPAMAEKSKSKSAKRNEKKKEKRQQASLDKETSSISDQSNITDGEKVSSTERITQRSESVELITEQIRRVSVSTLPVVASPSTDSVETSKPESSSSDIDKRIRAIKKKIRLSEAQLQGDQQNLKPEQIEKMKKLEGWREELKLLEDRKAN